MSILSVSKCPPFQPLTPSYLKHSPHKIEKRLNLVKEIPITAPSCILVTIAMAQKITHKNQKSELQKGTCQDFMW